LKHRQLAALDLRHGRPASDEDGAKREHEPGKDTPTRSAP